MSRRPEPSHESDHAAAQEEPTPLLHASAEDSSNAGVRDAAIVMLAESAHLNPSQLANLSLSNFHENGGDGTLILRRQDKIETIELSAQTTATLLKWISIRGHNLGPLFYSISARGDVRWGQGMTETELEQVLAKCVAEAGNASAVDPDADAQRDADEQN